MSDERLEILETSVAEPVESHGAVRINRIKLSNYRFFHGDFEILVDGVHVLIYGENGSGKSSIYRALEYLAGKRFNQIADEKNIFCDEGIPQVEFGFNNGKELVIDSDLTELPAGFDFIKGLSVFVPMLDYKKLLKVHFTTVTGAGNINVYDMLRELFRDFPHKESGTLSEIKNFMVYIKELEELVNGPLLGEINKLIGFFDADFKIERFIFAMESAADGRPDQMVKIEIDFKDNVIENYHAFLNEARLTSMAVSVYFAAIKAMLGTLKEDCLKILVLDDLLISLDMSNRLKLLDVLKAEFSDFQIFLFTHDKELFEIYKNKMTWEKYEFYVDDEAAIPTAKVIKSTSEIDRAKKYYREKEYDSCALQLRKGCENLLKSYLSSEEQLNKNGEELDFSGMLDRAKSKCAELKGLLERLDTDRTYILNRLCHDDHGKVYSGELRNAIMALETLERLLK
jgi:energy-coupling factor transporter ATP-binding protein EcfA2